MDSESTPLTGRGSARHSRSASQTHFPQYGQPADPAYAQLFDGADDDDTTFTIPRKVLYFILAYMAIITIAFIICIISIIAVRSATPTNISSDRTSTSHSSSSETSSSDIPNNNNPASITTKHHGAHHHPLPSSSSSHFLVLTDIHLEPHYDGNAPDADKKVCRDSRYLTSCSLTDWQRHSEHKKEASSHPSIFALGRYMCDPPYALVQSSLRALKEQLADIDPPMTLDFVVVAGDNAAHFIACPLTVYQTVDETFALVRKYFPSIPIMFAIGNTDIFPDYHIPLPDTEKSPSSSSGSHHHTSITSIIDHCPIPYSSLLSILLRHQILHINDTNAIRSFCHGGYYSYVIPEKRLRIVMINTIVWGTEYKVQVKEKDRSDQTKNYSWSINNHQSDITYHHYDDNPTIQPIKLTPSVLYFGHPPISISSAPTISVDTLSCSDPSRLSDPYGQFQWLQHQISLASLSSPPEHLYIVGHVPPGVKADKAGWCSQYWHHLSHMLRSSPNTIKAMLFGDYSEDLLRLVYNNDSQSFTHAIHINPGISPRKNCNPAARIYEYQSTTGTLLDYHQYYIQMQNIAKTHIQEPHIDRDGNGNDIPHFDHDDKDDDSHIDNGRNVHSSSSFADTNATNSHLVHWSHQYNFLHYLGLDSYTMNGISEWVSSLSTDSSALTRYISAVNVWKAGQLNWMDYICDLLIIDNHNNRECKRTGEIGITAPVNVVATKFSNSNRLAEDNEDQAVA